MEKLIVSRYTEPHLPKSALITIDTQNDFIRDDSPVFIAGTKEVIPNMVRLLDSYRKKGQLIVHVVRFYLSDGSNADICRREIIEKGQKIISPGTDGSEMAQEIKPDPSVKLDPDALLSGDFQQIGANEYVMFKPRWGAFFQTRLEEFLKEHDKDTLVFCGCNFPNCPRTSIYEASERDFRVVLIKDAISQLYPKGEGEMRNIGVNLLDTKEIEELLA